MLLSIGLVILGIVLLVVGGETLLRGAVGLAALLRLTAGGKEVLGVERNGKDCPERSKPVGPPSVAIFGSGSRSQGDSR